MKFKNPSLNFFFEPRDARTDAQAESNMLPTFSKLGHKKKWRHPFSHHNPICYHGNQWSDLAEFQTHPSSHVCYHYLQV